MIKHVDRIRFLGGLGLQFTAGLLATSLGKPAHLYAWYGVGLGLIGGATMALLSAVPAKRRSHTRRSYWPAPKTLVGERRTMLLTLSFALITAGLFLLIGARIIPAPKPYLAFPMVGFSISTALSLIFPAQSIQTRVEEHNRWLDG